MKELSLKEIQEQEKKMLVILINELDRYNITYFIHAGSFLGTIRHKGFIPWDDDIDICIERSEYEKLLKLIKKDEISLQDGLYFEGYEICNGVYPFLKVINPNILIEQKEQVDKYLWIDIFPLDKMPDDYDHAMKFNNKCFYLHEIYSLMLMKYKNVFKGSKTLGRRIIKLFVWPIAKLFNRDKYIKRFINYCKKYNNVDTKYIANPIWCIRNSGILKKDWLKVKKYKFEDIEVNGYEDYDDVLKALYGSDYMTPPPKNKRYTHSFIAYKNNGTEK